LRFAYSINEARSYKLQPHFRIASQFVREPDELAFSLVTIRLKLSTNFGLTLFAEGYLQMV